MDLTQCDLSGSLTLPKYGAFCALGLYPGPNPTTALRENFFNVLLSSQPHGCMLVSKTNKGQIKSFIHIGHPF